MIEPFGGLRLIEPLLRALRAARFETPTPIQAQAIPPLLEGHDLMGCAQTGSGKTAAFGLPLLQTLALKRSRAASKRPRALVLAPTRELAAQIGQSLTSLAAHLPLRVSAVFGGVNKRPQAAQLGHGVDVLVATPGRLLDHMEEGALRLDQVEIVVLDEADRMLDMGFIPDVERILAALPKRRQSLFFSATLPPEVIRLARGMLRDPIHIDIPGTVSTVPRIDQKVMFVRREDKRALLGSLLADGQGVYRALVFTRTKHRARDIARHLDRQGLATDALHGDKSQAARKRALADFHSGRIQILVATDIAARGLDVDDIDHVINYELPNEPESYVHRIGRTARAGKMGVALTLCDPTEVAYLRDIERLLKQKLPVVTDHPYHDATTRASAPVASTRPAPRSRGPRAQTAPRGPRNRRGPRRPRTHVR
jgi:ATP-dependent RNA helicase RhlE